MSIEYHGWVALATSHKDWSDGDFEEGFQRVRDAIKALATEEGHDPIMPNSDLIPQIVHFNGYHAVSLAPVMHAVQEIGAIFDKAYSELVVFDHADPIVGWDFALVTRHRLVDGQLMKK